MIKKLRGRSLPPVPVARASATYKARDLVRSRYKAGLS